MQTANRVSLLCLIAWAAFFLVASGLRDEADAVHHRIDSPAPVQWPLRLDTGDVLVSRLSSAASTRVVALDVSGVSAADFLVRTGVDGAWPVCQTEPRTCRLLVDVRGETNVYFSARNPVVVDSIEATVIRHQWATTASTGLPLLFLGVVLLVPLSWLTMRNPLRQRRLLLAGTLGILAWLQPVFTLLVVAIVSLLHRAGTRGTTAGTGRLALMLVSAAGILLAGKYAITGIGRIFANPGGFDLLLPLGISYVVIRLVDTQIRWYRNQLRDVPLDEFLFFVFFPATIAAGPVDTLERFRSGRIGVLSAQGVLCGLRRIGWGVLKKLVVADAFLLPLVWGDGGYAAAALSPGQPAPVATVSFLFLAFAYVYVDFSAYSDIAIGMSRLLGWSAPENFNFPFLARSVMDYWRRWHMSVSGWCMRNIYMPLLLSTRRPAVASMMVMLGVGMWHSIGVSWMLWAIHHGMMVALESSFARWRRERDKRPRRKTARQVGWRDELVALPARAGTLVWVAAGHAFAQIEDPAAAIRLYLQFWQGLLDVFRGVVT